MTKLSIHPPHLTSPTRGEEILASPLVGGLLYLPALDFVVSSVERWEGQGEGVLCILF